MKELAFKALRAWGKKEGEERMRLSFSQGDPYIRVVSQNYKQEPMVFKDPCGLPQGIRSKDISKIHQTNRINLKPMA